MAFFTRKAAVDLEDVQKFQRGVDSYYENTYRLGVDMIDAVEEMSEDAERRAKELEQIAQSFDQLYASVKQLEHSVNMSISSLKSRLSSTPKTLEKKSVDGEGNVKIKRVENPAYKELESQLKKEHSRLSSIQDLAYKVSNQVSYSRRVSGELNSAACELKNIIPELKHTTQSVTTTTERAKYSIEKTVRTIEAYTQFFFRS